MAKSGRLRLKDLRDIYSLIGECRDLGADSVAWRRNLLQELCRLVDAKVGLGGEVYDFWSEQPKALGTIDLGWADQRERKHFYEYMRNGGPPKDEFYRRFVHEMDGQIKTRRRRHIISDKEWYASKHYNHYAKHGGLDDRIVSFHEISGQKDSYHAITVHRGTGEKPFDRRERRIVHWLHHELGPLIGQQLAPATEPSLKSLSPRLTQTLSRLLDGDSEKQIAHVLGINKGTVHKYVTELYRHFHVHSRGELLAHWAKFDGDPHDLLE